MFHAAFTVALGLLALPVAAVEVIEFTKGANAHWDVGDKSAPVVTGDGRLAIVLTVKKSPNNGQSYYVLSFDTRTDQPVNFSARVADRPMQRTHFAARAEPSRPYHWGEHLPEELSTVYVMYRGSR